MPLPDRLETLLPLLQDRLRPVCASPAQLNAEVALLLEAVLGITPAQRYAGLARHSLAPEKLARLASLLESRTVARMPLQYLLGEAEFYGLTLRVTPDVLIPRPETEMLVELAVQAVQACAAQPACVVDLGSGSGAIALAIKRTLSDAVEVVSIDISEPALVIARENAARLSLSVDFRLGDALAPLAGERFDVIVSNPPYIDVSEQVDMQPEVLAHEPHLALFPAQQQRERLYFYRLLAEQGRRYLNPGGVILMELGEAMAEEVCVLFEAAGFEHVWILADYSGAPRVLKAVY